MKSRKSAWIGFLVLNVPYFVPSFGKIVRAVSENELGRTDGRTDGGDSIGPFGFQPGTKKIWNLATNISHLRAKLKSNIFRTIDVKWT